MLRIINFRINLIYLFLGVFYYFIEKLSKKYAENMLHKLHAQN